MKKQDLIGKKAPMASRLKPTKPAPPVFEVLKVISGTLFVFQLAGEGNAAMPYASDRLQHMTGVSPEEVAENATPLLARIHPDDIEPFFASAQASAEAMTPWHIEFRLDHTEKKEIWIEWQATPVRQQGTLYWHGMLLDITQRKTIQWRQELLEAALNQSSDTVFLINEKLGIEYVNDYTCRKLGYSRDELLGMQPMDIDPSLDLDTASSMMQRILDDESITTETHHLSKDGHLIPVEINGALVEFGGRRFSLTVARDISERRRMLEELQHSEQAYRHLVENLPDNIARYDTEGRYIYINPTLESNLCVSAKEILGTKIGELNTYDCSELLSCTTRVAATGKPAFLQRLAIPDVNGETRLHDLKLVPEFDDHGQVTSVLNLGRDMTDFYRAQEIIAANEREMRLLQRAINATSDSIFVIGQQLRIVSVNDAACRSLGYRHDELTGMTPLDINPDFTQERVEQSVLEIDEADSNQAVIFETRHRTKDGDIFPVEIASTAFFEDGQKYAIAVARDISERKQASEQLRRREREFRTLTENIPDNVVRWDP
jgi:PAS domain S-box-containing protein